MHAEVEIWTYRDAELVGVDISRGVDLTGFGVEALDGSIGKIDEATYEVGSSYIVVDTGPWIFGSKVMLPAGVVERVDLQETKVYVDRTKDQIKAAPPVDGEPSYEEHANVLGRYYASGGPGGAA
jgi:hypothetical protein